MHTILFDGVCNFCNSSINFVIDHDSKQNFVFAPLQSNIGRQLLRDHSLDPDQLDSVVLVNEGKVYRKSDAALQIARNLDGLWPLLYGLVIVPRPLRDLIYDWIARNRYKWFGRQEACRLPTPELRQRFIA